MTTALDGLTAEAFGRKLRAGEVSAREVTEACLERIEADNPRFNAFVLVMADEAREQAHQADRELAAGLDRGPLHGVPVSIKDLLDVRGTRTTAASRVRLGHPLAEHDAPAVAHLRQAGAIFIGKTNLHEFAFGTTSEDSAFGPARNPHDLSRSAGGSSGGAAVSVATGMSLAALGTDTGGSIRIPAAACGIVGLKPTYGEVSADRVVPLSRTLDHVGPLARSVADAWLVYRGLLGTGLSEGAPAAGSSRAPRGTDIPAPVPIGGLRLAVPRAYFCDVLDDEVRARFEESLGRLRAAGARIDETDIAHASHTAPVYLTLVLADAAAYHAATLETMPELYTPPVRIRLEMGRLRSRGGLRPSPQRARGVEAGGGCRRGRARRARAAHPPDSSAAAGRRFGAGGRRRRAGSQFDVEADATLQLDGPSGDFAAVRPHRRRLAVRSAAGGRPRDTPKRCMRTALACEPYLPGK